MVTTLPTNQGGFFLCVLSNIFSSCGLQWFQSPEGADGVMPFVTWWWSFHGSLPVWLSCSAPSFLPASVTSARQGCCPEQTGSASPVRRRTNTQSESEGKTLRCFKRSFRSRWRIPAAARRWRTCAPSWLALAGSPGQRAELPPESVPCLSK